MTTINSSNEQESSLPDRTVSDLSALERYFDERLFRVVVNFAEPPTVKHAANLKRAVPQLANKSIAELHRMIVGSLIWSTGDFNLMEAEALKKAIEEQGFTVSLQLVTSPGSPPTSSPDG